jgi:fatty acid desaturase
MNITKINGKYYDITNFNHPGGKIALSHSFDRDATVLFNSYHPFISKDKIESIFKKYEIETLPDNYSLLKGEEDVLQFDFNTHFSIELKEEVKKYFDKLSKKDNIDFLESLKATKKRLNDYYLVTALKILSNILWLNGWWISLMFLPLFDWLSVNAIFHEAAHFSLSRNQYINQFACYFYGIVLTSPQYWYIQHNICHHSYSNIPYKDSDIHIVFTRYHYIFKKTIYNPVVQICLIFSLYWVKNFKMVYEALYDKIDDVLFTRYNSFNYPLFMVDRTIYIVYYYILPLLLFNFKKALLFIFIPQIIFSFFFMLNSQISHIHTECLKLERDWYKHQIEVSTNHGTNSLFNFIFSGGLNHQIEHHLFPNVNHCHLPNIKPIVKKLCNKYNIKYKEFNGYKDAFLSYYNHLVFMNEID